MEGARVRMVSIIRIFMLFTNCSGSSAGPEININVGNGRAGDAASTLWPVNKTRTSIIKNAAFLFMLIILLRPISDQAGPFIQVMRLFPVCQVILHFFPAQIFYGLNIVFAYAHYHIAVKDLYNAQKLFIVYGHPFQYLYCFGLVLPVQVFV